jgi:L-asparagine oxygenase
MTHHRKAGAPSELGMHSSLFVEIPLTVDTFYLLSEQARSMPPGIYGNLIERQDVLSGVPQLVSETLRQSEAGNALRDLSEGRVVAVRLTGLPVDPSLPPAPLDGGLPHGKNTYVSEALGLGIAYTLGEPSLLLGEKEEALVHQITPVAGREQTQSNEGQVNLQLHQDLAAHPDFNEMPYDRFMPDFLILTGVQLGAGVTKTSIASLDDALARLSSSSIGVLSERRFVTNPPDSFIKQRGGQMPAYLPIHPVLREYNGRHESSFDISSGLRPVDPRDHQAAQVLKELESALTDVRQEIVIEPGTAVAFNNRRAVHGRGAVIGAADSANKRWLQRVYVMNVERMFKAAGFFPIMAGAGVITIPYSERSQQRLLDLAGLNKSKQG